LYQVKQLIILKMDEDNYYDKKLIKHTGELKYVAVVLLILFDFFINWILLIT